MLAEKIENRFDQVIFSGFTLASCSIFRHVDVWSYVLTEVEFGFSEIDRIVVWAVTRPNEIVSLSADIDVANTKLCRENNNSAFAFLNGKQIRTFSEKTIHFSSLSCRVCLMSSVADRSPPCILAMNLPDRSTIELALERHLLY